MHNVYATIHVNDNKCITNSVRQLLNYIAISQLIILPPYLKCIELHIINSL